MGVVVAVSRTGSFNYDIVYREASAKSVSCLKQDQEFSKEGFLINHSRVLVGSGLETFERGKVALHMWRHFGLNWALVDPKTPIRRERSSCVKEFLPWILMPLQVVYVNESRKAKKGLASFGFGLIGYPCAT